MSLEDLRGVLGNEAFASQKALSRYAPQPQGEDNPLDELDREMLKHQQASPTVRDVPEGESQKASDTNPLDDLDREFEEQSSSPEKRAGKQFLQGMLASPAELLGGGKDIYNAGKEVVTQKPQEYGTGAKLAKKYGVPTEPERATWYERLARAEGTGAPITALGTYLGGPVGGAATALGIGASALAEPYIAGLADKLPWHLGPAAQIAAGALLGRKIGKVAGNVLTKKPITPTVKDFENSAHANYGKVDNSGITLEPNIAANETANKTLTTLGPGADINSPRTVGLVNLLQPDPKGTPTDIRQVTAIYKALGRIEPVGPKMKGNEDYRAANIAREHIKDYLDNIPNSAPYSVVSGHQNIPEMYENWSNANADWAAARRIDTINKRFEAGMAQAGTTYSGGNAFNAIRQKFRPLVDPLRFNRQFNADEQDYIKQHFVHGTLGQNALRLASRLAPDNAFGMWGNVYAGANALAGSPAYLGITAASLGSLAARQAAKAAQRANLREFRTMTASRAPLFRKLNPGFVKSEHEIGPGTAGGAGGALESLEEAVPEYIHQGLDISKEAGGVEGDEKKKKEEGGGYSDNGIGDRLLKAMGRLPGPSGSVGGYGKKHGGIATGDFDIGRASRIIGGYEQPTERFADPEAFRLTMARKAAMPRSGIADAYALQNPLQQMQTNPQPQTAVGGGLLPMAQTAIGGGITPTPRMGIGGYSAPAQANPLNVPGGMDYPMLPYDPKWLQHAPFMPHTGGPNAIPNAEPGMNLDKPWAFERGGYAGNYGAGHVGGYDGVTGLLDKMAAPIVAEHSQPWSLGRAANVLGQALTTMGPRTGIEVAPSMADVISPTQFGAAKSPQVVNPQYSTGKSDKLPEVTSFGMRPFSFPTGGGGYDGGLLGGPYSAIASGSAANTTQPTPADIINTNMALNRADPNFRFGRDYAQNPDIRQFSRDIGMAMAPIEAYHGSPYDFDQFKSEKIGTGEGAQVYGHGLYFAENPNVASTYKNTKPRQFIDENRNPIPVDWDNPIHTAIRSSDLAGGRDAGIQRLKDTIDSKFVDKRNKDVAIKAIDFLKSEESFDKYALPSGKMYNVEIGSEPEHFLDWDKPLSEQSEYVKQALGKTEWGADYIKSKNLTGGQIAPKNPEGSKQLQDTGIPGIRYLDQNSRVAKDINAVAQELSEVRAAISKVEAQVDSPSRDTRLSNLRNDEASLSRQFEIAKNPTHSYVVFDPSIIRIMRKYGILGPAAVAGSALSQKKGNGGYRPMGLLGGYGMGQVSPLAGGTSF